MWRVATVMLQGNGCYDFSYIKPAGCPKDDDHHGYGYASGSSSSTEPVDAASTSAVDAAEKQRGRHQHHHNDEDEDEGVHGTHRERHHREDDFHGKDDDDDEGVYLGPVYKQRHGDDDDHDDDTHDRHQHWSRDKTEEEEEHKQEHRHPSYEGASDSRAGETDSSTKQPGKQGQRGVCGSNNDTTRALRPHHRWYVLPACLCPSVACRHLW